MDDGRPLLACLTFTPHAFHILAMSLKKRLFQVVLLTSTAASLFYVPWAILGAWLPPLPDSVEAQLEAATNGALEGIIVYADFGDGPPVAAAVGWHDAAKQLPARPDALFKIASISKLYVAVAVTKLAARGELDLDAPLRAFLPEYADRIAHADRITPRMLVQHRSGIPNFTDVERFWSDPPGSSEGCLELVLDAPADFEPGADWAYSNTNYLLLGFILDRVCGEPHFAFIQSEILDRLGLTSTFAGVDEFNEGDVMSGFHVGHPHDLKGESTGMVATAADVAQFVRALNDGSVFDAGEAELYATLYEFEHTGLVPGYQSTATYHKDLDAVVVQFSTPTDFNGYQWNLAAICRDRVVGILERDRGRR